MRTMNPKLRDKAMPRKHDLTTQGKITAHQLKAGATNGKKAVHIPELRMTVWVMPGVDEAKIRKKYLDYAFKYH
jgi:hypothetical protein